MLNFTYYSSEGVPAGKFNGRYAFRAKALNKLDLGRIANADPVALRNDEALRHEFLHWKVFRYSRVGRALIGKRYWIRLLFLMGYDDPVRTYYKQRTAYFMKAYKTHEGIVEQLEVKFKSNDYGGLINVELGCDQINEVHLADKLALVASRCRLNAPLGRVELWMGYLLSRLMTREFGVKAYLEDDAQKILHEVSVVGYSTGVFNAIYDKDFSVNARWYIPISRSILRFGIPEKLLGEPTDHQLARWVFLKFSTEIAILRDWESERHVNSQIFNDIEFIGGHINVGDGKGYDNIELKRLRRLLLDCGCCTGTEILERLKRCDRHFLYFFYNSGN